MSLKPHCGCAHHTPDTWQQDMFFAGAAVIVNVALRQGRASGWRTGCLGPHQWHSDLQQKFTLHPVVASMLAHRPKDWQHLLLEWPHISEKDPALLAYTRDDAKGQANLQTLTSVGKYVARHWPHVADHVRRDACALYTPDRMEFLPGTVEDVIRSVQEGPKSCMQADFEVHPYEVYDPKLGWAAAVRFNAAGRIDGRALTWTSPTDSSVKGFVRTYARCMIDPNSGYSNADQILAAWLESQGFKHWRGWLMGTPLAHVESRYKTVLPYIDGDNDHVCISSDGGTQHLEICEADEADYQGDSTCGYAELVEDEDELIGECTCCGNDVYEADNRIHVGQHEEDLVGGCCSDDYSYVRGQDRRGRTIEYYVRDDNVVHVNGERYDEANLPDNIRQLENGDYIDTDCDDYCEIDDELYLTDDDQVVLCEDGEYRLRDDCWECFHSNEWYSNDDTDDQVEVDGETYHRDSLSEIVASQQVAPALWEMRPVGKTADEYNREPVTA